MLHGKDRDSKSVGRLLRALTLSSGLMLIGISAAGAPDDLPAPVGIAVLDFDYVDTSGEVRDQRQEHETRLRHFSEALRSDLARSGRYRIVTPECGAAACATAWSDPSELITRARAAGARILLLGGIHKMSTLIQMGKVQMVDIDADKVVWDKSLTFRGDTDEAWDRAEAFVSGEIMELPVAP